MVFSRTNYVGVFIALLMLTLGFVCMSSSETGTSADYSDSLFNFRQITLAPLIIIATYISLIFLIIRKPNNECLDAKKNQ